MAEEGGVIITPDVLQEKIRNGIEGVIHCQAVDFSDGCGSKFEITIVSPVFSGLKIIAQHRLVHKAIEEVGRRQGLNNSFNTMPMKVIVI